MTATLQGGFDFRKFGRIDASSVDVGFFSEARYPTGQLVAQVAAWQEFGTRTIPERPFFRGALRRMGDGVLESAASAVADARLNLTRRGVGKVGEVARSVLQESVVELRDPPNAPSTVARKGSTNPLVDTGQLVGSVTYRVNP